MAIVEKNSLYLDSHSLGTGRRDSLAMAIQKPKFPQYAVVSKRLESFEKWPKSHLLSAEVLSEAGLVYIGTGDGCRCYHCGGGLRNWEEGDDPWVEHAKWYPTCGHVKLVKGDHFINAVSIGETPQDGQYETDVGPEDEDYLGTAAALSCLQMGFEEADVKKAIKKFIDTNGHAGFKGQELCEIIFDLEESENSGQSTVVNVIPTNVADGLELGPEKSECNEITLTVREPTRAEWLSHVELYQAISKKITASHITGLQRVGGLWRIYLDNLNDKVVLMAEGVPIRGKSIPILNTNPNRLDSEITTKVLIKNVPLSVEDGVFARTLTLLKIEVISLYRDKLRVDGKLTNCETGDRVVIVKSSTLTGALPNFMTFGKFVGRVVHFGQNMRNTTPKCSMCMEEGHTFSQCTNDCVCNQCKQPGHKQMDCIFMDRSSDTEAAEPNGRREPDQIVQTDTQLSNSVNNDALENPSSINNTPVQKKSQHMRETGKSGHTTGQLSMDSSLWVMTRLTNREARQMQIDHHLRRPRYCMTRPSRIRVLGALLKNKYTHYLCACLPK